jgi:prepilin-type N-terminal cleavage/methylation domain-containing protein
VSEHAPLQHEHERGYNLVEVLIAIAVLGSILLSIVTLFFWGTKNVYSGKMMTMAISVGTDAVEDLSALTIQDIYGAFVISAANTLDDYTIDGITYEDALIRSTDPNIVTNAPADIANEGGTTLLAMWRDDIVTQKKMAEGTVTLILQPRQPTSVGTTTEPAPRILRLRVIVRWVEALRQRHVVFDTVRYRR